MTMTEQEARTGPVGGYGYESGSGEPVRTSSPEPGESPGSARASLPRKSPVLAGVLSLLPGLGQAYVGYYQQGFFNILVIAGVITLLNAGMGALDPLLGLFLAFFWLFNVVDAVRRASLYNLAIEGATTSVPLPDLPHGGVRGSLMGGIVLIVAGVVLFSHTYFDYSLYWVSEWWPVVAIGLGIYLVVGWARNRKTAS
jgi:hypothetical protein